MANKYYAPDQERARKVRDLFAAVAARYDLINDLQSFGLHRRWKRQVVQLAGVTPSDLALDVCCGTGDLAFGLASAGARVLGLDFSEPMLRQAGRRARARAQAGMPDDLERRRLGVPRFARADALRLPCADAVFSAVTVGYGLRNLADLEGGLREMWRVLKPGGRGVILDFGKPDNRVWRRFYFTYLRLVVPWLGRLVCGDADAYAYIVESLKAYPGPQAVAESMREIGYRNVTVINLLGGAMGINCGEKPM